MTKFEVLTIKQLVLKDIELAKVKTLDLNELEKEIEKTFDKIKQDAVN